MTGVTDTSGPDRRGSVRTAHNSFFLISSQVVTKLVSFGGIILLARLLDVTDFGVYALALAVTGILSLFVELGLDQLSIREIARDHGKVPVYVTSSALVKLVMSTLALAITAFLFTVTGIASGSRTIILIFMVAMVPAGAFHTLTAVFMGIERMVFVAVLNAASELLRFALFAGLLLAGYRLVPLAWSYVSLMCLMTLLGYFIVRRVYGGVFAFPEPGFIRAMVRESLPFMFYGLFFIVYFKIDFIMLAAFRDEAEVGTYAVAYRLTESLMFIPAAFMGAVYPSLSRLHSRGGSSVLAASQKTLRYMAMIGLPIGFGTTVLAARIVPFLFGENYTASIVPLQIVIWAMVLIFINCICPVGLNSVDLQRLSVLVTGAGIIFNVALNLILIPPFGAIGTSSSTVATEVLTTAIFLALFSRHIGRLDIAAAVYRPLAASVVMAGLLIAFHFLPLWVLIPGGVLFYAPGLFLFGALSRNDLDFFRSVFGHVFQREVPEA